MKNNIFAITIISIGIFLRIIHLGTLPNSYSPDELAQGYTAYSIMNTQKDEWGNSNLLSLLSFGDYKPPLQTWLMIPSIYFFGLTPFAVRLPNALLSITSLIAIYFLVRKMFPKDQVIALTALTLLSLSPWSVSMSRIALEANIAVSLIVIGLFLLYNHRNLLSTIVFSLSIYTYHSSKVFLPLFLPIIYLINFGKKSIYFLLVIIFLCLPYFTFQSGNSRASDIAIFNPTDKWANLSDQRFTLSSNGLPDLISRIIHNKITYTVSQASKNYLSYLSPQFLLTQGAGETTYGMLPGFGVIGLASLIGLVSLILHLLRKKIKLDNQMITLISGILISPIAASLAKGNYAANRASLMLPFLVIASAVGIEHIHRKYKIIIYVILIVESVTFFLSYFYSANQVLAHGMLYGHREVNQLISELKPTKVIYSRKLSEPQAYYLFFQKIDPKIVQQESTDWNRFQQKGLGFLDQLGEYKIDKTVFKEISLPSDLKQPNTLIIGKPEEFLDTKPTHIIYYPYSTKKEPAIYLYLTKNEE